jgi:hypothetical protein
MTPFSDPPIFQSANPYVGPSTFAYEQHTLFFGRESEARDLLAWVLSERLLLFYAQSGAGKSSLLHTRLIPRLQEEKNFVVLPVGRVSGDLPAEMSATCCSARMKDPTPVGWPTSPWSTSWPV